ncbi:MAG: hypothetical protein FWE32_01815 [Oscillospiraceae bacterium]|nr:hypothetical protein [Oscillospiraceae bacterium]
MRDIHKATARNLYGLALILTGLIAALWGGLHFIFSDSWILLPPAALVIFVGRQYLRRQDKAGMPSPGGIKKQSAAPKFPAHSEKKKGDVFLPTHGGRQNQSVKAQESQKPKVEALTVK